ncbi:MAG: YhcH/YjgK/YiaL family protein [Anaerolineales bacterium]
MIIDRLTNSSLYYALHPSIRRAFEYIHQAEGSTLPVGKYEIDGEALYAMVQQYNTKSLEQGIWEAHRRYIDLQVILQGSEKIGYANLNRLTQGEYNAVKDFLPLFGEGDLLTLQSGSFAIFLPEDAHMPGIAIDTLSLVKKVVIKIAVL